MFRPGSGMGDVLSLRAVFPGTARQGRCAKQSPNWHVEIASSQSPLLAMTAPPANVIQSLSSPRMENRAALHSFGRTNCQPMDWRIFMLSELRRLAVFLIEFLQAAFDFLVRFGAGVAIFFLQHACELFKVAFRAIQGIARGCPASLSRFRAFVSSVLPQCCRLWLNSLSYHRRT